MALRCSTNLATIAAIASTFLSDGALFIVATSLSNSVSCSFQLDIMLIIPIILIMFPCLMPIMSMQQEFSSLVCSAGVGLAAFSAKTVASGIAVAVIAANRKFVFMFLPFVSVL